MKFADKPSNCFGGVVLKLLLTDEQWKGGCLTRVPTGKFE